MSMENIASKLVGHKVVFLLLSFIIHVSSSTDADTSTTTTGISRRHLVIKLIHPYSSLSPYYNPNATIKDHARQAIENSMARFAYLIKARTQKTTTASFVDTDADDDITGRLLPQDGGVGFLVNFSIGEPPVPQLALMDTGSNLLWLQCLPCTRCFNQSIPIFDPSKSSTYANLSCNSPYCVASINGDCDSAAHCRYSKTYSDGTSTIGNLGTEKLMFVTSDEGTTNVPSMVFGCGLQNYWYNIDKRTRIDHDLGHDNDNGNDGGIISGSGQGQPTGILGLGPEKASLISQLGSKFSYCFGDVLDPQYSHNQLILGDGAKMEGYSTPILVYDGHYYLTLGAISVGEKRLDIKPHAFTRVLWGKGGVMIDTGTTYTYLARVGFEPLSAEVQNLTTGLLERVNYDDDDDNPEKLCYKGMVSRDLKGFPVVTYHFARGADLVLDTSSMFYQNGPDEFCMAVLLTKHDDDLSIIGMMAQQYYNIAYDLHAMELSFQRIDCELLQD